MGVASGASNRSKNALGHTSRHFPLRVVGNLETSAMTSSQMLLQLSYMQAAFASCTNVPKVFNLSNGIRIPFAVPLEDISSTIFKSSLDCAPSDFDELLESISSPGFRQDVHLLDQSQLLAAKEWIFQWLDLAEKAHALAPVAVRLQASRLLSSRNYQHCKIIYSLFRGTFRDAFWLTSFAVERYCSDKNDVELCWSSFARFLKAISLEVDAISSWLIPSF